MEAPGKIYLDVSALGRQFDDQTQARIRTETEAVALILDNVARGNLILANSVALWNEVSRNPNLDARQQILDTLSTYGMLLGGDEDAIASRTTNLVEFGNTIVDSLHVAIAELHRYDFVCCDDRLLKRIARQKIAIWSGTPVAYCASRSLI